MSMTVIALLSSAAGSPVSNGIASELQRPNTLSHSLACGGLMLRVRFPSMRFIVISYVFLKFLHVTLIALHICLILFIPVSALGNNSAPKQHIDCNTSRFWQCLLLRPPSSAPSNRTGIMGKTGSCLLGVCCQWTRNSWACSSCWPGS